jgi:hypothetical protein
MWCPILSPSTARPYGVRRWRWRSSRWSRRKTSSPCTLTQESAQRWISEKAPVYCARGYFMDKTLTPDSFEIKPLDAKAA